MLSRSWEDRVMQITETIVREKKLTTLMITHHMKSALTTGDRTVMMDSGQVLFDMSGAERASLSVDELMRMYSARKHRDLSNDRMLL